MTTNATRAKNPAPEFVMAAGNALLRVLLRSPLHGMLSNSVLLLSFNGRKSGKAYTFPVGYARDGDTLQLVSNHDWWKNLRDNALVTVWLQGQKRNGVANASRGDEEAFAKAFAPLAQKSSQLIKLYDIHVDSNGQLVPESVRQAAHKSALIRIRLM
jgi:deazaflavin-dependent oxidoreductase (nitroreductase family)